MVRLTKLTIFIAIRLGAVDVPISDSDRLFHTVLALATSGLIHSVPEPGNQVARGELDSRIEREGHGANE